MVIFYLAKINYSKFDKPLKLYSGLFFLAFLAEYSMMIASYFKISNWAIDNYFLMIEALVLGRVFYLLNDSKLIRKVIVILISGYFIFWVPQYIFRLFDWPRGMDRSIRDSILFPLSLITTYNYCDKVKGDLLKDPWFWILSGFILNIAGMSFRNGTASLIDDKNFFFYYFLLITNVITYFAFIIALKCFPKNSSSSGS